MSLNTLGRAYAVRSQFPGAGQFARHAAADLNGRRQDAAQGFFDDGLSLLDDEQRLAFRRHAAHEFLRQRVLRYFEHRVRASVGIVLREVVVGDAAGDDAQRFVFSIGVTVEGACGRLLFEAGIVGEQCLVSYARIARHQHPLARPGGIGEAVLGACLARFDHGTRVGHAGRQAHQYGNAVFLREVERGLHHLVGLLLRGGLERRDKGELAVEARVLLVLRRVHRGVVGRDHDQPAVGAGHRRIDECVGGDVHAHVLHADQRPFSGKRHAQRLLHRRLLIGRPCAVDAPLGGERMSLYIFGDFGRRRARIGIYARQSGVERRPVRGLRLRVVVPVVP